MSESNDGITQLDRQLVAIGFARDGQSTWVKRIHGGKVKIIIHIDGAHARMRSQLFHGLQKSKWSDEEWEEWRNENVELDASVWPALDYVHAYLERVAIPEEKNALYLSHERLLAAYRTVLAQRDDARKERRILKEMLVHKGYLSAQEAETADDPFEAPRDWS